MLCLKCGKKTADNQVFCEDCLEITAKYPVKPGTVVQLPVRAQRMPDKKQTQRRREDSTAELVEQQKKTIRWLFLVVAVLSVLLLFTAGLLLRIMEEDNTSNAIGKNYTTTTSVDRP